MFIPRSLNTGETILCDAYTAWCNVSIFYVGGNILLFVNIPYHSIEFLCIPVLLTWEFVSYFFSGLDHILSIVFSAIPSSSQRSVRTRLVSNSAEAKHEARAVWALYMHFGLCELQRVSCLCFSPFSTEVYTRNKKLLSYHVSTCVCTSFHISSWSRQWM